MILKDLLEGEGGGFGRKEEAAQPTQNQGQGESDGPEPDGEPFGLIVHQIECEGCGEDDADRDTLPIGTVGEQGQNKNCQQRSTKGRG